MSEYRERLAYAVGKRRFWESDLNAHRAKLVIDTVEKMEQYLPLTVRQIHYQLFSNQVNWCRDQDMKAQRYRNIGSVYQSLDILLKWLRIDGVLEWELIEDRSRYITEKVGYDDAATFLNGIIEVLNTYQRCRIQSQKNYIELWCEKDALVPILERVADIYCLRVVACKGNMSISFIGEFFKRAEEALESGRTPIVLYFGDLDFAGVNMYEKVQETLGTELGLDGVEYEWVAVTPEQGREYNLANDPEPKTKGYEKHVKRVGHVFIELDSLHPSVLQDIAEQAILRHIDIESYKTEIEQGKQEKAKLQTFKYRLHHFVDRQKRDLGLT